MLERTAGCLETGSFRRLLPGSSETIKNKYVHQAKSWNHGAPSSDTSLICHIPSHSQQVTRQSPNKTSPMSYSQPSSVFLDFLYPPNTLRYLRNCSQRSKRPGRRRSFVNIDQRRYASSILAEELTETVDDTHTLAESGMITEDVHDNEKTTSSEKVIELEKLHNLLEGKRIIHDFEEVWRLFHLVPSEIRGQFVNPLILYLAQSSRTIDAERIISLFDSVAASSTAPIREALLNAHLQLGDLSAATQTLEVFIKNFACSDGCAKIFSYAITSHNWNEALRIYSSVANSSAYPHDGIANVWIDVEKLPDLPSHTIALAKYASRGRLVRTEGIGSTETPTRSMLEAMIDKALVPRGSNYEFEKLPMLLEILHDWKFEASTRFERLIPRLFQLGNVYFASRCYRLYRKYIDTNDKISQDLLRLLISKSTVPEDIAMALDDWTHYHGNPVPEQLQQIGLTQISRHGDIGQVLAMSKRKGGRMTTSTLEPILNAYAKRGQLSEVLNLWRTHFTVGDLEPNLRCWTMLITAYGKVNDHKGAVRRFHELLKTTTTPDSFTFAVVMQICAKHGDFVQVTELYRLAETLGIQRTPEMINAVVLGHVKEDRMIQAENVCINATKLYAGETLTESWNLLLTGYAFQRNLVKITALFQKMQQYKIPHNDESYAALMQCLAMVGQPARADLILRKVLPGAGIVPNQFHYAVVMGGYLATRETNRLLEVHARMRRQGLSDTISTRLLKIKASAMIDQASNTKLGWNENTREIKLELAEKELEEAISISKSEALNELFHSRRKGTAKDALDVMGQASYFAFMMFTYGAHGAVERVKELYQEHERLLSEDKLAEPPIKILTALMSANLKTRNYAGVQECWELAYTSAKKKFSGVEDSDTGKILDFHRYALAVPLSMQIQSLSRQHRFKELALLIDEIQAHGFSLDLKNWNIYCQALVISRHYKAAFEVCETKLMSGFSGFAHLRWRAPVRNRLSIEHRIWKKDLRNLRPLTPTLLFLARALLDLHDNSLESRDAQKRYAEFRRAYPRTVAACETLRRTESDTEHITYAKSS